MTATEWRRDAACRDTWTEIFYDREGVSHNADDAEAFRQALAYCHQCPVTAACLADEIRYGAFHQHGIRGGLTAPQRIALITGRRPPKETVRQAQDETRLRFWAEGLSDVQIAARTGTSKQTIQTWRTKRELDANHPPVATKDAM